MSWEATIIGVATLSIGGMIGFFIASVCAISSQGNHDEECERFCKRHGLKKPEDVS